MAEYEIELTKKLMKTITVTVPDDVPAEEVKEWVNEFPDDLFDVEPYQGTVKYDVDDMLADRDVPMTVCTDFEAHDLEVEGFHRTDG